MALVLRAQLGQMASLTFGTRIMGLPELVGDHEGMNDSECTYMGLEVERLSAITSESSQLKFIWQALNWTRNEQLSLKPHLAPIRHSPVGLIQHHQSHSGASL